MQKKIAAHGLLFLVFVSLSFLTFRFHVADIPHAGAFQFMQQREAFSNDWDFFKNALSLNRTRFLYPQDSYLFRPGFMATLSTIDIFFRENLWVSGALSILWHAMVCFIVFMVAKRLAGKAVAVAASFYLLSCYQGMNIVLWRHISPYLIAIGFFLTGLWFWNGSHKKKFILTPLFFGISLFFHEALGGALLLVGTVLLLHASYRKREVIATFFLPAIVYCAANALDFFLRKPGNFFSAPDQKGFSQLTVQSFFEQASTLLSWFSKALFLPAKVQYGLAELGLLIANPVASSFRGRVFGAAVTLMVIGLFFYGWKKVRSMERREKGVTLMLLVAWSAVLAFGLLMGRMLQHDDYLRFSTYYFYFFAICVALGGAAFVGLFSPEKKLVPTLFVVVMFGYGVYQQYWIRELSIGFGNAKLLKGVSETADSVLHVSKKLAADDCYGGWIGGSIQRYAPAAFTVMSNSLLYRQSCLARKGNAAYLFGDKVGDSYWMYFTDGMKNPLPLNRTAKPYVAVTAKDVPFEALSFNVKEFGKGGVLVGYKSDTDFIALRFENGLAFFQQVAHGRSFPIINQPVLDSQYPFGEIIPRNVPVTLRKIGNSLVVFKGSQVVHQAIVQTEVSGKVGVFGDLKNVTDLAEVKTTIDLKGPMEVKPLTAWVKEHLKENQQLISRFGTLSEVLN